MLSFIETHLLQLLPHPVEIIGFAKRLATEQPTNKLGYTANQPPVTPEESSNTLNVTSHNGKFHGRNFKILVDVLVLAKDKWQSICTCIYMYVDVLSTAMPELQPCKCLRKIFDSCKLSLSKIPTIQYNKTTSSGSHRKRGTHNTCTTMQNLDHGSCMHGNTRFWGGEANAKYTYMYTYIIGSMILEGGNSGWEWEIQGSPTLCIKPYL